MFGIALPSAVGLYLLQDSLVVAARRRAVPGDDGSPSCRRRSSRASARNVRTHVADQVFVLIENTTMVCLMTIAEGVAVVVGCLDRTSPRRPRRCRLRLGGGLLR